MGFLNGHISMRHVKGDTWKVRDDFRYYWERMERLVVVPEGQETDHATRFSLIPDMLLDNTGPVSNGAGPHDMFYRIFSEARKYNYTFKHIYDLSRGQYWTKKEADQLFFDINAKTVMPWHERFIVRIVKFNNRARREWMTREAWDQQVINMDLDRIDGLRDTA